MVLDWDLFVGAGDRSLAQILSVSCPKTAKAKCHDTISLNAI